MARSGGTGRHEKRIVSSRKTLKGYSGQSLAELLALEETYTTDSLMRGVELALHAKLTKQGLTSLSWAERVVVTVQAFERAYEQGGGFLEFYQCDPVLAPELVSAYEKLECPLRAKAAKRAYACLDVEEDATPRDIRKAILAGGRELTDILEDWDQRCFSGEDDLEDRLFEFVRKNRDWIRLR